MEKMCKTRETNYKNTMNPNTNNKRTINELYDLDYKQTLDDIRCRLNNTNDVDKVADVSIKWLQENGFKLREQDKDRFCRKMVSLMIQKENTYKGKDLMEASKMTMTKIDGFLDDFDW